MLPKVVPLFLMCTIAEGVAAEPLSVLIPPLRPHVPSEPLLGHDDQLFDGERADRHALLRAVDHSLGYLASRKSGADYRAIAVPGVTRERVERSLRRYRELVRDARSAGDLQVKVNREFEWFRSVGNDGRGRVKFTGYFTPIYLGSLTPSSQFRYPLYRPPAERAALSLPRGDLEGRDGLTPHRSLRGQELVYLASRFDAFVVHVQGSAKVVLPDQRTVGVGFADANDYPFSSISGELVRDGRLPLGESNLPGLRRHFAEKPGDLDRYLPRNRRFVFFRKADVAVARGSLGVPVTPERSIATDKTMMPPGALALIRLKLPFLNRHGGVTTYPVSRFVLDQDTGSAIKTPGRVDIYMGLGGEAGERAGRINTPGELYYLLLKQ